MNVFSTTKLATLAIAIGVASILYITPHKEANILLPSIELSSNFSIDTTDKDSPVPEPATMLLFGTGLAGFATVLRGKKK